MQENSATPGFLWSRILFFVTACALALYGLFFIYSTGYICDAYPVRPNWQRQCVFLAIGTVWCCCVSKWDYKRNSWELFLWAGYALSLAALFLVLMIGKETGGAKRWLDLGFIQIQPAEFAKVFTVLLVACIISKVKKWHVALGFATLVTAIPFFLILVEPSYGSAIALLPSIAIMAMLRWFGQKLFFFSLALLLACLLLTVCALFWLRSENGQASIENITQSNADSFMGLKPYHLKRIKSYLDPKGGWNERQAIFTISSGGPFGKGYLQGSMKGMGYLPRTVAPSDFIFSVIGEELGFFYGCFPVICLYTLLFAIALHWASHAADTLGTMLCVAVATLLFTNVGINISMTVRLIPIIGLPLPLLSYGGSYAIATLIALGAMASVPGHAYAVKTQNSSSTKIWKWGRFSRITLNE